MPCISKMYQQSKKQSSIHRHRVTQHRRGATFCVNVVSLVQHTDSNESLPSVLCLLEHLHQALEGRKQALILSGCQQFAAVVPQVNGRILLQPQLSDLRPELGCPQETGGGVGRQALDPVSG